MTKTSVLRKLKVGTIVGCAHGKEVYIGVVATETNINVCKDLEHDREAARKNPDFFQVCLLFGSASSMLLGNPDGFPRFELFPIEELRPFDLRPLIALHLGTGGVPASLWRVFGFNDEQIHVLTMADLVRMLLKNDGVLNLQEWRDNLCLNTNGDVRREREIIGLLKQALFAGTKHECAV